MFDGEDALGQIKCMSLDNQRNLKLAIHKDPVLMEAARKVADEMNAWTEGFHGRKIIDDWQAQLGFTTKILRARGLHLDDRHIRDAAGNPFSASIVDMTLYVVINYQQLRKGPLTKTPEPTWPVTRSARFPMKRRQSYARC